MHGRRERWGWTPGDPAAPGAARRPAARSRSGCRPCAPAEPRRRPGRGSAPPPAGGGAEACGARALPGPGQRSGVEVVQLRAEALLEAVEEGDHGAQTAGDGAVDLRVEGTGAEIRGELAVDAQQPFGLTAHVDLRPDPVHVPLVAELDHLDLARDVHRMAPAAPGLQHAVLVPGDHELESVVVEAGTEDLRMRLVLDVGVTVPGQTLLDPRQGQR